MSYPLILLCNLGCLAAVWCRYVFCNFCNQGNSDRPKMRSLNPPIVIYPNSYETFKMAPTPPTGRKNLLSTSPTPIPNHQTTPYSLLETLQRGSGRVHFNLVTRPRFGLDFSSQSYQPRTPRTLDVDSAHISRNQNSRRGRLFSSLGDRAAPTRCATICSRPICQPTRCRRPQAISQPLYACCRIYSYF